MKNVLLLFITPTLKLCFFLLLKYYPDIIILKRSVEPFTHHTEEFMPPLVMCFDLFLYIHAEEHDVILVFNNGYIVVDTSFG